MTPLPIKIESAGTSDAAAVPIDIEFDPTLWVPNMRLVDAPIEIDPLWIVPPPATLPASFPMQTILLCTVPLPLFAPTNTLFDMFDAVVESAHE
jgi:hypothetical protein